MGKVKVKKGNEVYEIDNADLQNAIADGFSLVPTKKVEVSNGKEVLIIDDSDLQNALKDGYSLKKKDGAQGSSSGFGPSPFDIPALIERPSVAVTKDGKKLRLDQAAVPQIYKDQKEVLKGVQERIAKGTPTFEDLDIVKRSNPTYTEDELQGYVLGSKRVGDTKRMQNFIAKNNQEYGLQDTEAEVLKDDLSINAYIEKISGNFGTKKREQINAQIPVPSVPYQTYGASKAEDYIRLRSELEEGAVNEFSQMSKDYLAQLREEGIRKVVQNKDLTKDEKIKRANALIKGTKAERILQSSILQSVSDKAIDTVLSDDPQQQFLNFFTGRNPQKSTEILMGERFDAEVAINNVIYKEAEALASEMQTATPERKQEILAEIEELKPQLTDTKELMVKYPTKAQMLMAQGINELKLSIDPNIKGNDDAADFTQADRDFASSYIGKNVIKGPMKDGAFNLNASNGRDALAAVTFLQSQGYLSDPKLKPIADGLIRKIITGEVSLKDPSVFGGLGGSIASAFTGAAKGIGDILGIRSAADAHAENLLERGFPTEAENVKFIPATARNIVNTTAGVISQASLQMTGAGMARGVGMGAKLANNVGFWASGALPEFDQSYRESIDIIEGEAGRKVFALFNAGIAAATEKIFPDAKILNIPGVKNSFAEIAQRFSNGELTGALYNELMGKAKNAAWQFAKDTGVNITKETIEEEITKGAKLASRVVAGDESVTWDVALNELKETAYQTATGTLLVGAMGAYSDAQRRKFNTNAMVLYTAAQNHDEAHDAIMRKFDKDGDADARDISLRTLNTSADVLNDIEAKSRQLNLKLTDGQAALYVANKTTQLLLANQKTADKEDAVNIKIDKKIAELKKQESEILDGKVIVDENLEEVKPQEDIKPVEEGAEKEVFDTIEDASFDNNITEVATAISGVTVIADALKDEQSTTMALEKVDTEKDIPISFDYDPKDRMAISKAYHAAKKSGDNPLLVKSVEDAVAEMGQNENAIASTETVTKETAKPALVEGSVSTVSENPAPPLTKDAEDLIASVGEGSMPAFITKNLERIASENGVEITDKMTAVDVVNALKDKQQKVQENVPKTKKSDEGSLIGMDAKSIRELLDNEQWVNTGTKFDGSNFKNNKGGDFSIQSSLDDDGVFVIVKDNEGNTVAQADFRKDKSGIFYANEIDVDSDKQGSGIGRAVYDHVDNNYGRIEQSSSLSGDGRTLWENNRYKAEERIDELNKGDVAFGEEKNMPISPNERDAMVQESVAAAKKIEGESFFATMLRDSAEGGNMQEFEEYMQNVSEQANDPNSRDMTVKVFGQEVVDYAQKMFPQKDAEAAERKDGLDKKQVDKILDKLDALKIKTDDTLGVNIFPVAWNAAVNITKFAIRNGVAVADALNKGLVFMQKTLLKAMANEEGKSFKEVYADFTDWLGGKVKDVSDAIPKYAKILFASTALNLASIDAVQAPVFQGVSEQQQELNGLREANIPKIEKIIKDFYAVNDEEYDPVVMQRAISLWEAYGMPTMLDDTVRLNRAFSVDGKGEGDAIFNIKNFDDFIAEMAHIVQFKSGAKLDTKQYGSQKDYDAIEYERVGSAEYDAHKILESIIGSYIMSGPLSEDAAYTIFEGSDQKFIDHVKKSLKKYKADVFLRKDAIQWLDTLKIKPNALLALPPGIDLITGFTIGIWNGGIEAIKKSIILGDKIAVSIQKGIAKIRELMAENGSQLTKQQEDEITAFFYREFVSLSEKNKRNIDKLVDLTVRQDTDQTKVFEYLDKSVSDAGLAQLLKDYYNAQLQSKGKEIDLRNLGFTKNEILSVRGFERAYREGKRTFHELVDAMNEKALQAETQEEKDTYKKVIDYLYNKYRDEIDFRQAVMSQNSAEGFDEFVNDFKVSITDGALGELVETFGVSEDPAATTRLESQDRIGRNLTEEQKGAIRKDAVSFAFDQFRTDIDKAIVMFQGKYGEKYINEMLSFVQNENNKDDARLAISVGLHNHIRYLMSNIGESVLTQGELRDILSKNIITNQQLSRKASLMLNMLRAWNDDKLDVAAIGAVPPEIRKGSEIIREALMSDISDEDLLKYDEGGFQSVEQSEQEAEDVRPKTSKATKSVKRAAKMSAIPSKNLKKRIDEQIKKCK